MCVVVVVRVVLGVGWWLRVLVVGIRSSQLVVGWWLRVLVVGIRSSQAKAGSHRKS